MSLKALLGGGKSGSPAKEKDAKSAGPLYEMIGPLAPSRSLNREINPALILENHKAPISFIHVQENLLVTAALDGNVTLWDYKQRIPRRTFKAEIKLCVMRGNILLTAGPSGNAIYAWDVRSTSTEPVARLLGHSGQVKDMQQSGEFLYTCSTDGSVRTWDLQFAEEDNYNPSVQLVLSSKCTYSTPASPVNCFAFLGAQLLIGHGDGMLRVWKTSGTQPSLSGSWSGHTGAITCISTTSTGVIATGSQDGTVRLWSSAGACQAVLKQKGPVLSLAIRGDNLLVLTVDSREVVSWSIKNGKQVRHYESHTGAIMAMRTTLLHLYTASRDGTLRRFELRRGHCENIFTGHTTTVTAFKIRGSMLLSGENNGNICVWDVLQHDLETADEARQEADFLQEELNFETRECSIYLSVQDLSSRATVKSKSEPNVAEKAAAMSPIALYASTPNPIIPVSPRPESPVVLRASAPPGQPHAPFNTWPQFFELCRLEKTDVARFTKVMLEEGMELAQIPDLTSSVLRELNFPPNVAELVLVTTRNARLVRKGDQWRLEPR